MINNYYLGDLCDVKGGKRIPAGETLQDEVNEHPYIKIVDMYQGKIIEKNELIQYSKLSYYNKIKNYTVKKGDVILAIVGNTLGISSIIGETLDNANLTENCCKFINIDKTKVTSEFIYYSLNSPMNQNVIQKFKVGSSQPKLPIYNIEKLLIPAFSLNIQNKISSTLSSIDSKIIINNKIISELESMAKTLYDYWFLQFEFPNEEGKPYKSSGGKMVYNDELKREIPEGWELKKAYEICSIATGKEDANHSTENGKYPFFTCSNDILKCDDFKFDSNSILIAGNGDFNVKHYSGKFNAYQRTYVITPNEEKYIGLLELNSELTTIKFKKGSNGSIVKFITLKDIQNIELIIPNNDSLLKPFNDTLDKIGKLKKENHELVSLRDFLLPMLMNGQIIFK